MSNSFWNVGILSALLLVAGGIADITLYVPSRQLYYCTITVVDALTGATVGTSTVSASTVPKGGV